MCDKRAELYPVSATVDAERAYGSKVLTLAYKRRVPMTRHDVTRDTDAAQARLDLGCAVQALRRIAYHPDAGKEAVRIADSFLRGLARRMHCAECGEAAEFVCSDGRWGCYSCAANAGDAS